MAVIFAYGGLLPGGAEHGLVKGAASRRATVRGRLWRDGRRRLLLQVDEAAAPVEGVLLEVDDARLPVLDLLDRDRTTRVRVRAVVGLRAFEAWTWAVQDTRGLRPVGGATA